MKNRINKYTISATILAMALASAPMAQPDNPPIRRVDLQNEAAANNPSIKSARLDAEASSLMIRPAGALPDPMLELGIMSVPINTFSLTEEGMTQLSIMLTQNFPFPGKLRLATQVAGADADAAKLLVKVYEDKLRFDVARIFNEIAFKIESYAVVDHHIGLFKQYSELAASKYSVGQGSQWDVFSAQVQMAKLMERLKNISSDIAGMRAMLAGTIGRADGPVEGYPEMEWTPVVKLDEAELIRRADENNSTLMYLKAIEKKSDAEASRAERERFPNFSLSLAYGQRSNGSMDGVAVERPDLFSASVGIEIPLYASRKQLPMARSARTMAQSAREMSEERRLMIAAEIRSRVASIRKADEVAELYRTGILPQAGSTLKSAVANYRVGKVDFMTLIESELDVMDMELMYYETRIERETDFAALELLVGGPVR